MFKSKKKKGENSSPQGIVAKGNVLYTTAAIALLAVLLPVASSFAYLLLVREPQIQQELIERASASWATQQATNIHHSLSQLNARINAAAQSPLAKSLISSPTNQDLSRAEAALHIHFPDALSLRIIPVGDMGTARFDENKEGLRSHIEVDLVRRTASGEITQPEAFQFEARWLTSIARQTSHPDTPQKKAVIIVTIDNETITKRLRALDSEAGRFDLQQVFISSSGSHGSGTHNMECPLSSRPVPKYVE